MCPQIFQIFLDWYRFMGKGQGISKPEVIALMYGHIFKFSIDALVNMLVRIGRELIITTRPKNRRLESGSLPKLNQTYCECQKLLVQIGSVFFGGGHFPRANKELCAHRNPQFGGYPMLLLRSHLIQVKMLHHQFL